MLGKLSISMSKSDIKNEIFSYFIGFFLIFCTICSSQFWCKENPEFLSFRISILGLICQSLKAYLDHGISIKAKSMQNFGNTSKMVKKGLITQ